MQFVCWVSIVSYCILYIYNQLSPPLPLNKWFNLGFCLLFLSFIPHLFELQLKEMGGRTRPSDSLKMSDQPAEKKKGLGDWMNLMKPANEEKDHWVS